MLHIVWWLAYFVPIAAIVDESLHLARELLISMSVRNAALFHLPLLAVLGYLGATYTSLTFGLSWGWTMVPLYAVGAVALAEHIARDDPDHEDAPAPEWYFARSEHRSPA